MQPLNSITIPFSIIYIMTYQSLYSAAAAAKAHYIHIHSQHVLVKYFRSGTI